MRSFAFILTLLLYSFTVYAEPVPAEIRKAALFTKVWGFLKYYHPEVAKGKIDWDSVFINNIKKIEKLHTATELNRFYAEFIHSLGEVKKCKSCHADTSGSLTYNLNNSWIYDTANFSNEITLSLDFILHNRNTGSNYYVSAAPRVGNTLYKNEKPYTDSAYPAAEMRLLGLSRYWNIVNYFYPYKYRLDNNWDEVLVEMLPKFKHAADITAYHLAMTELVADLNDTHAAFNDSVTANFFGWYKVPFYFRIIEEKAVVTGFYNDTVAARNDILKGDVFLKVNGKSIGEILSANRKYQTGSNEAAILRTARFMIFSGHTDSVKVSFERNGTVRNKKISRALMETYHYHFSGENETDTFHFINPGIGYVNMGRLQIAQVKNMMDVFKNTKAIIFDIRNYPNNTFDEIKRRLKGVRRPFAKFSYPDINYPGLYHFTKDVYTKGNQNGYAGKVILLFNEFTQSHAEFTVMVLETADNVIKIGSQTAGADGNISLITFPGGYQTYMTGIGVFYPDGTETQRIGIRPDITVNPTIAGIKAGKDEVLEKAIEAASKTD